MLVECHEYQNSVYEISYSIPLVAGSNRKQITKDKCGFKSVELIIGGTDAKSREFPHMALLGYSDNGQIVWSCGGTLISERFILTAAHCMNGKLRDPKLVRVGDLNIISTDDDALPEEINIEQIFIHPDYKRSSKKNDIALIQLERNVNIDAYKRPACLPSSFDWPQSRAIASGWGRTDSDNDFGSEHLQKVIIEKFTENECNNIYSQEKYSKCNYNITYNTQVCVGSKNEHKDTCQGDSGGPLQVYHPNEYCMYEIVGVTSFGSGCGTPTVPGVYTRVFPYINWIESIVWR